METSGWQKVNQVLGSLRTGKVGDQCETIVKLPSVFEEYPFPILIDAVFLKLGDMFRECNNNFIRFCILKVILSTAQHHNKISGKEIFLRPVLSVIHSNDAVARSITLRVLGVSASLFPEKKNVLHAIVRGLDSHMELERDAALFACKQYASMSQDVSKTVVPKLEELLTSLSTTESLKIKILDVFQSMDYDLETSIQIRNLCFKLMRDQATERVTDGCLRALTQMMLSTLSSPREVIELLLSTAEGEMRKGVRCSAFRCLEKIAAAQSELLNQEDVMRLVELVGDDGGEILCRISSSPAKQLLTPHTLETLSSKLGTAPLSSAVAIYQICATMMPTQHSQIHFYPLLVRTINSRDTSLVRRLLLSLSKQDSVNTTLLFTLLSTSTMDVFIELCYCLSSLKGSVVLDGEQVTTILSTCDLEKGCYFVKLVTVLYGQCDGGLRTVINDQVAGFVGRLAREGRRWSMYCIMRIAMCHGVYKVALKVIGLLRESLLHPYSQNFFKSLEMVCCAELSNELKECISLYDQALLSVKCCKNSALTHFQSDLISLRLRLLKIYLQLRNLSNIAAMNMTDDSANFAPTLRFIGGQVSNLIDEVRELESRMIDAKPRDNLKEFLLICNILSVLCSRDPNDMPAVSKRSNTPSQISQTLTIIKETPESLSSISFIKQTVTNFLSQSFALPYFYFVQEQNTSISLATSPAIDQGIIKIAGGCNLLLTLEAVVRGNSDRIKSVLVSVTCEKAANKGGANKEEGASSLLYDKEVALVKGYLKLELDVNVQSFADVYSINAKAVDFHDALWNVGSNLSFRVKCDDSVLSKSQMAKAYV
ncbi:hypothetical protein ACHWQZ_G014209 [Mnemiopsis leidyi]